MHLLSALPVLGALYSPLTTSREGKEIKVVTVIAALNFTLHVKRSKMAVCVHSIDSIR